LVGDILFPETFLPIHQLSLHSRFLLTTLRSGFIGCHTICWMAPFMIIGRWIRNRFAWPSLRLVANSASCVDNCSKKAIRYSFSAGK
jgi:hypothetical protein